MAKTKTITFSCENAHISPNGHHKVELEVSTPDTDTLLSEVDEDDLISWMQSNKTPDAIFSETQLERWAEANGYVKGE